MNLRGIQTFCPEHQLLSSSSALSSPLSVIRASPIAQVPVGRQTGSGVAGNNLSMVRDIKR